MTVDVKQSHTFTYLTQKLSFTIGRRFNTPTLAPNCNASILCSPNAFSSHSGRAPSENLTEILQCNNRRNTMKQG